MSEVTLKSDFNSFEGNVFYVSQAQRSLYLIGKFDVGCKEEWFSEYIKDLYFDSFNKEFKSFYIEADDEYNVFSDASRNEVLVSLVSKAIKKVYSLTESELETYLSKPVEFDHENSDIFRADEFIKEKRMRSDTKKPALRVLFVLLNFRRLLLKEQPFAFEKLEENLVIENGV